MARRIRNDDSVEYELRKAEVYRASKDYPCDLHGCGMDISKGEDFARINTGIRVCNLHFQPEDVVNAE